MAACSKHAHKSYRKALAQVRSMAQRLGQDPSSLHPYFCPYCHYWHVGHVGERPVNHLLPRPRNT